MPENNQPTALLPDLFRQEYTKITAVLCRYFSVLNIDVAEDIASDTFLRASERWAIEGIPPNPQAWLYRVARNKAIDYLRQQSIRQRILKNGQGELSRELPADPEIIFNEQILKDSQLAMIFAVCDPVISSKAQMFLALQVLCGFSIKEIAAAFLIKPETAKKQLLRARNHLRKTGFQIKALPKEEIRLRLQNVLRTIYLLFNEGYYSASNEHLIRRHFCTDAMRLGLLLRDNSFTHTGELDALLALMCYQSSRINARVDSNGLAILYENQDADLWDQDLVMRGNQYLVSATNKEEISKYHLEAAIAYWHTTKDGEGKWQHILKLYDQLVLINQSPSILLSRLFVVAMVHGKQKAICEAESGAYVENEYFHRLLGYIYTGTDRDMAIFHYRSASMLAKSEREQHQYEQVIQKLGE